MAVTIENELGVFAYDEKYSWFTGKVDWAGEPMNVLLSADANGSATTDGAMAKLQELARDKAGFLTACKAFAAQELVELANDWLEDDDSPDKPECITEELFVERLSKPDAAIAPNGSITLYFDDGDLFWGHTIAVYINADGSFDSADLAG